MVATGECIREGKHPWIRGAYIIELAQLSSAAQHCGGLTAATVAHQASCKTQCHCVLTSLPDGLQYCAT